MKLENVGDDDLDPRTAKLAPLQDPLSICYAYTPETLTLFYEEVTESGYEGEEVVKTNRDFVKALMYGFRKTEQFVRFQLVCHPLI